MNETARHDIQYFVITTWADGTRSALAFTDRREMQANRHALPCLPSRIAAGSPLLVRHGRNAKTTFVRLPMPMPVTKAAKIINRIVEQNARRYARFLSETQASFDLLAEVFDDPTISLDAEAWAAQFAH